MPETAGLPREKFGIRWVRRDSRVGEQSTPWWLARFVANCFYHNMGNFGSEPGKIQQFCLIG